MKTSKFTEGQIAFVLKQAEDGTPVAEVCRKAGIAEATFYNWRKRYAGLMPSEVKRLRQLEEENAKLKRIVADLSLDKAMLQDVLSKMYDLPRPGKDRFRSDDGSPPKCIRPLASGPLLRPGHDEIRAQGSQINGSCRSTLFCTELTMRRSTVSSSRSRASLSVDQRP